MVLFIKGLTSPIVLPVAAVLLFFGVIVVILILLVGYSVFCGVMAWKENRFLSPKAFLSGLTGGGEW